ncbi:glutamine amidotransferase-related protein [Acinetobacter sp.]|uniref:glutamine amidotransferase-related protein n=1 Tax=Acinetobacter sp. TaxID=472 RepID=UPI00388E11BE
MFAADFPDTVYAIQHVAFEDLGVWEDALYSVGLRVRYVEAGVEDLSRALQHKGLTIILGGPLSVHDRFDYPFLSQEIQLLKARIAANLPTLGIGLGAALIAYALGATVKAQAQQHISWSTLQLNHEAGSLLAPLATLDVLHWQSDAFELPQGAHQLAAATPTASPAFIYGHNILALPFHIEIATDSIEKWLIGHSLALRQANIKIGSLRGNCERLLPQLEAVAPQVLIDFLKQLN